MTKLIGTVWYFNTSWKILGTVWYVNNSLKMFCWKKSKTSRLWILDNNPITRGVWSSSAMKYDLKQLIYTFCWTKIWKVFETSIWLSIFDDIKKSPCSEIAVQRGWLYSSDKEKHSGIIVGLTWGFDNLFSLTPLFFMVQPYAFELLTATLLSFVVSLLTCRSSVKRIKYE